MHHNICCGARSCGECDTSKARLSPVNGTILIVDTNVALHQIALLESPEIDDVVVLASVVAEVFRRNPAAYERLCALCSNSARRFYIFANDCHRETYVEEMDGESAHDRNDRAIRRAALRYQSHLRGSIQVLLVTNDEENKQKAIEEGIYAETVEAYVRSLLQPDLLDLVVLPTTEDVNTEEVLYSEHKTMSEITSGLNRGIYRQGKLRVSHSNPCDEAYVEIEGIRGELVVYGRDNMNRAFDGDIVAVQRVTQVQSATEPASHPAWRVVGIIKRNWQPYCGSLEPMPAGAGGAAHALFIPKNRRIPKIQIQTQHLRSIQNKRIIVDVDSWDRSSQYPSGHHVRTIGEIGDKETETEEILIQNDINSRPFSAQVLACLPPFPWALSSEDLANPNRKDLRHLRVFSVDPPGCRDIDDALHCTSLPNGNFEVGVHIADVTNFVLPDTPLDKEAAGRGTSIYLVDRRIGMLPKYLTEVICSLLSGVDRLAFSVIWEMTPEGEIVSTRYTKSAIKSCAALSYAEAQARMDDNSLMDPLTTDLRNLNSLAKVMRRRRIDRGALTLASAGAKFQIDTETLDALDLGIYQIREANQMIEEFMLSANVSVAENIFKHFPGCSLLRRHPSPPKERLEPLLRTTAAIGLELDISSSKALADSLDRAVGDGPCFNKLIRILAARCMPQAVYFCSGDLPRPEFYHYGLAEPLYTRFTSPIRRYADVIVHRLLSAALQNAMPPPNIVAQLTSIADNLNNRDRNARRASRASDDLHTLIYFRDRPTAMEARILKIIKNGFIAFVPDAHAINIEQEKMLLLVVVFKKSFGIEEPVYLIPRRGKGGDWVVDEANQKVTKTRTHISYGLLQTVRIHLEVKAWSNQPKLHLTLIEGDS